MIVRTLPRALGPGLYAQRGRQILDAVGFLKDLFSEPSLPPSPTVLERTKAKLTIGNVETGEWVEAMFNPVELTRVTQVDYAEADVVGSSFRPQQYKGTSNQEIRLLLQFNEIREGGREVQRNYLRFLESLCYPETKGKHTTAPPLCILLWPGVLSITCTVREWEEVTDRFAYDSLEAVAGTVSMTFKEFRRTALSSSVVREKGGLRP